MLLGFDLPEPLSHRDDRIQSDHRQEVHPMTAYRLMLLEELRENNSPENSSFAERTATPLSAQLLSLDPELNPC